MGPIILYTHAKKLGRSLEQFWSKVRRSKKKPNIFGHLIPYNPGSRIFSVKQSCSDKGPYCPLHSCKKLERSLDPFLGKVETSKKNTFFGHLIPYNPTLRIFSGKPFCSKNGPNCLLHSCKKLGRSLKQFWNKGLKTSHGRTKNTIFFTFIPYNAGLRLLFKNPFAQFWDFIIQDYPAKN